MLKVGIVGAAGYAGAELVRIVLRHPEFDLRVFQNPSGADFHRIGVKIEN